MKTKKNVPHVLLGRQDEGDATSVTRTLTNLKPELGSTVVRDLDFDIRSCVWYMAVVANRSRQAFVVSVNIGMARYN
jgi:hypothetical protein